MDFQLIKGNFTKNEALHILTQMVDVKIRFHESKIGTSQNEEDIKMREGRIKQLQNDLHTAKQAILTNGETCGLDSAIKIS